MTFLTGVCSIKGRQVFTQT